MVPPSTNRPCHTIAPNGCVRVPSRTTAPAQAHQPQIILLSTIPPRPKKPGCHPQPTGRAARSGRSRGKAPATSGSCATHPKCPKAPPCPSPPDVPHDRTRRARSSALPDDRPRSSPPTPNNPVEHNSPHPKSAKRMAQPVATDSSRTNTNHPTPTNTPPGATLKRRQSRSLWVKANTNHPTPPNTPPTNRTCRAIRTFAGQSPRNVRFVRNPPPMPKGPPNPPTRRATRSHPPGAFECPPGRPPPLKPTDPK